MAVAEMLTQQETLALQALCCYLYRTGVPRIQSRFTLRGKDLLYVAWDHLQDGDDISRVYNLVKYNTRSQRCICLKKKGVGLLSMDTLRSFNVTIQVGLDMLAFVTF